jgi:hypothetical protein
MVPRWVPACVTKIAFACPVTGFDSAAINAIRTSKEIRNLLGGVLMAILLWTEGFARWSRYYISDRGFTQQGLCDVRALPEQYFTPISDRF